MDKEVLELLIEVNVRLKDLEKRIEALERQEMNLVFARDRLNREEEE